MLGERFPAREDDDVTGDHVHLVARIGRAREFQMNSLNFEFFCDMI
jgi:hypothetical protein